MTCQSSETISERDISHQNVDLAQGLLSSFNGLFAVLVLSDIGWEQIAFPALGFDSLLGLFCILFFFWKVDDETVGTFLCKENGNCPSNPTVTTYWTKLMGGNAWAHVDGRACDEGLLPFQLSGCLVLLPSAIGGRQLVVNSLDRQISLPPRRILVGDLWEETLLELALSFRHCEQIRVIDLQRESL
jgi:hypothetical protein